MIYLELYRDLKFRRLNIHCFKSHCQDTRCFFLPSDQMWVKKIENISKLLNAMVSVNCDTYYCRMSIMSFIIPVKCASWSDCVDSEAEVTRLSLDINKGRLGCVPPPLTILSGIIPSPCCSEGRYFNINIWWEILQIGDIKCKCAQITTEFSI